MGRMLTMPRFAAGVTALKQTPSFAEAVALVRAGLTWTEAQAMTRRERIAFLETYGEQYERAMAEAERRAKAK